MNPPLEAAKEGQLEPLDVELLLTKTGELLKREISNLMSESSRGKLSPASARDLTAYIRLLSELKEQQKEEINNMTDEELEALAKKAP